MNTLPDLEGEESLSRALLSALAANEDSILKSSPPSRSDSSGWDAFDVWRRMIKEPRDRRWIAKNVKSE